METRPAVTAVRRESCAAPLGDGGGKRVRCIARRRGFVCRVCGGRGCARGGAPAQGLSAAPRNAITQTSLGGPSLSSLKPSPVCTRSSCFQQQTLATLADARLPLLPGQGAMSQSSSAASSSIDVTVLAPTEMGDDKPKQHYWTHSIFPGQHLSTEHR